MARFGWLGLQASTSLQLRFRGIHAPALMAGNAAHSFLPLDAAGSASFGLVLAVVAQTVGWPCARGGSAAITDALAAIARSNGAEIRTGVDVRSMRDLPPSRAVLFDTTPRQLARIAGEALSSSYRRHLEHYAYGPGAFKVDYALAGPIPWTAPACRRALTVHVGGSAEEVVRSEAAVAAGRVDDAPFVLVAQQSVVDPSRAPDGRHTGWAYCHVPAGYDVDVSERVERQIERFAPGFRDTILARHVTSPAGFEAHNPNLIGGDIAGGDNRLRQVLLRPVPRWNPYATSNPRLFICSSSTPPGGGVHGMCGYWAAVTALRRVFRAHPPAALAV
jgi:phytoene dehydrogenase-like protein